MSEALAAPFPRPLDGEWVNPIPEGYLMECCDCCLVHKIDFRIAGLVGFILRLFQIAPLVQFRAMRDNHTTEFKRDLRFPRQNS